MHIVFIDQYNNKVIAFRCLSIRTQVRWQLYSKLDLHTHTNECVVYIEHDVVFSMLFTHDFSLFLSLLAHWLSFVGTYSFFSFWPSSILLIMIVLRIYITHLFEIKKKEMPTIRILISYYERIYFGLCMGCSPSQLIPQHKYII